MRIISSRQPFERFSLPATPFKEGAKGLYPTCEALLMAKTDELVPTLYPASEVKLALFNEGPQIAETARRALARAGYDSKNS